MQNMVHVSFGNTRQFTIFKVQPQAMIDIHAKESKGPSIAHLRAALSEAMEDEMLADVPAPALPADHEPEPDEPAYVEVEGPTQFSQSRLWEWPNTTEAYALQM